MKLFPPYSHSKPLKKILRFTLIALMFIFVAAGSYSFGARERFRIISEEFVFPSGKVKDLHAGTILQTPNGKILCACYGKEIDESGHLEENN